MTHGGALQEGSGKIAGLDGLRALAILLVILWHTATLTSFPQAALSWLKPLVLAGWSGVDLFFALSGFLITRLILLEEAASGGSFDLRAFYARRALRILPASYLVLGLNLLAIRLPILGPAVGDHVGGPLEVFSLFAYWSNYFFSFFTAANPAPALLLFWSLCVEEHFYLLWPFLLLAVKSSRTRLIMGLLLCGFFPLLRLTSPLGTGAVQTLSHLRLDSILWGALGALAFDRVRSHPRESRTLLLVSGLAVVILFGAGLLSLSPSRVAHSFGLSLLAVFFTTLVVRTAAEPSGWLTRALEATPLRLVGRVSYGMYLLHMQCIVIVTAFVVRFERNASLTLYLLVFLLSTVTTLAAALAMYAGFEARFLSLKSRFFRTPGRAPAE